jgi:ATP-dependent helicase/nuclease subunit A
VVNRGKGFYDTREVNDLTQLLRVIANPRDEIALAAVLRSPLAGVSDEALLALKIVDKNIGAALADLRDASLFGPADWAALTRLRARLLRWRERRERDSFDRLLLDAIDEVGYRAESGARGSANVEKFLAQARDAAGRMSLDAFVEELAAVRDSNPREPDAPPEDSSDTVKLMTAHSAKGLEFPIVFAASLHKGIDTGVPVVAFSPRVGLGARWREGDDRFQHAIREERKQREEEESSRLLYVAMTRAEEHLVLSFSGEKRKHWAEVVEKALTLRLAEARDEVEERDGFRLRVQVADAGPGALERVVVEEQASEPTFVVRPVVTGQYDSGVAVTAVTHVERPVWGKGGGAGGAAELGSEVHALLAGVVVTAPASAEAVRLAEVFRKGALAERVARASRVEREFDFVMAIEDVVVHGQIDLWFEEGGELVVVDYKTDRVSASEVAQRASEYAAQVRLYGLALERLLGRAPDRAYLHFLRANRVVEVDLRPSLIESPEEIVREYRDRQERERVLGHE